MHQLYQDKIAESHRVRFLKTYIENNFKHFEKPEYASFVKENQSKEEHIKELDQQQPPVYHLNRGEKFGLSLQKYFLNCHLEKRTFLSKIEERVKLFVLKRLCLMGIYIQKISQKFNSDGTKRRLLLNLSNDYYAEYKKIFRINILKQANDCTSMKNIIYSTTLNSNDYKSAVEKYENCISNLLNCENERKDVLQSLEKYEQAHVNPMEYRHALKVNSLKANWLIKFDFDEQLVIKIKDVKERVKFMDLTRSYYESITKRWDTFDPC
ncbi:MAG: hypothetical protein JHC93_06420 [Parachlamydiales bacterium]|nr:hypothetical protein [Parachlamydiales bacterium]